MVEMATSAPKVLLLGFGAIGRQLVTLFGEGEFEVKAFVRTVSHTLNVGPWELSFMTPNCLNSSQTATSCWK